MPKRKRGPMETTTDERMQTNDESEEIVYVPHDPVCSVCDELATISFTPLRLGSVYACRAHAEEVEEVMLCLIGTKEYRVRKFRPNQ
jgi:hypothetical protein